MLKVDQAFVETLQKGPLPKEVVTQLHADIQPPRLWHQDKLTKFLANLTKQTKQ